MQFTAARIEPPHQSAPEGGPVRASAHIFGTRRPRTRQHAGIVLD